MSFSIDAPFNAKQQYKETINSNQTIVHQEPSIYPSIHPSFEICWNIMLSECISKNCKAYTSLYFFSFSSMRQKKFFIRIGESFLQNIDCFILDTFPIFFSSYRILLYTRMIILYCTAIHFQRIHF